MGRRRGYSVDAVVTAARDAFWERGYEGAAVSDLEAATGLSRSSLYQAFGSKQQLFVQALDAYIRGFIDPLLCPLESETAGASSVEDFVRRLVDLFRQEGLPSRCGCLWANSIAGLGRDQLSQADIRAAEYWDRLYRAFSNGLRQAQPLEQRGLSPQEHRARLLAVSTFAAWLIVPVDPERALGVCEAMLADIHSWRQSSAAARR